MKTSSSEYILHGEAGKEWTVYSTGTYSTLLSTTEGNNLTVPITDNEYFQVEVSDDYAERLWEKMYLKAKKVIETCRYCGSGNAITNGNCIQCGAPI